MLQESASWSAFSVYQRNGRGLECCASVVGVCWRSQGDWPWWIGLPFFGLLGSCRKFGQRFPPSDCEFCDFPGLRSSPRERRWSLVVRCVAGGSFRKRTDVGVGRRPVCLVRSILSVGVAFGRSGNGDAGDVPQVPGRHPSGHGDPPGIFIGVPAMEDGCAVR